MMLPVGAAVAELQRAGRDRRAAAYRYWPPVRIVVPVPICATPPVPEIVPAKVTVSERLKARSPLSRTSPTMLPTAPPSPSCSVPAVIVVPPV